MADRRKPEVKPEADKKNRKKSGCVNVVIVSAGYKGKSWTI